MAEQRFRLFLENPGTENERPVRIAENDYSAALQDRTFEEAAVFRSPEGQRGIIPRSGVKDALAAGWKPENEPNAVVEGAKFGGRDYSRGQGWEPGGAPQGFETIDETIAREMSPAAYHAGRVGGIVGLGMTPFAALGLARGATAGARAGLRTPAGQKVVEKAKPVGVRIGAAAKGASEAWGEKVEGGFDIPIFRTFVSGAKAAKEAVGTWNTVADLQKAFLRPPMRDDAAQEGSVKVPMRPDERPLPGIELVKGGGGPLTTTVTRYAAISGPGRQQQRDLERLASIPSDVRQSAREFSPRDAAKAIIDDVNELYWGFREDRGEAFRGLTEAAKKKFYPAMASEVRKGIAPVIAKLEDQPHPPRAVIAVLESAQEIINSGRGSNLEMRPGRWNEVTNAEKFDRVQEARRVIRGLLTPMQDKRQRNLVQGVSAADFNSIAALESIDKLLTEALHKVPEKAKADLIYKKASDAYQAMFKDAVNNEGEIEWTAVERLLGERGDAGKLFRERVAAFDKMLDEHGKDISGEDVARFKGIVQRIAKTADDADTARFVKGQGWVQGPSSASVERMAAETRKRVGRAKGVFAEAGVPAGLPEAFAGELNRFDQFRKFAKEKYFAEKKQLTDMDESRILEMFRWFDENTSASPEKQEKVFRQILTPGIRPPKKGN